MGRYITLSPPENGGILSMNSSSVALVTNPTPTSSGGTITTSNGYRIHTFTTSGTFTLTAGVDIPIEYLAVAGGGGGASPSTAVGGPMGAGGGAGGLLTWYSTAKNGNDCIGPSFLLNTGNYISVVIGAAGAGSNSISSGESWGSNTTLSIYNASGTLLNSLTVYGGSNGGQSYTYNASPGGSGGGSMNTISYTYDIGRMGPPRQGNPGAHGLDGNAGGGGAGGAGSGTSGGAGHTSVITGSVYSAGGSIGGAAAQSNKAANTGNGGDAPSAKNYASGNGGSGIVVIRYVYQ